MKKELKIRIADYKEVEKLLEQAGAKFIKQDTSTYTYFTQPAGKVLKITQNNEGSFKTVIERSGDQFNIIENSALDDPKELLEEYSKEHGIKKAMSNIRRFFEYKDLIITTNQFKDIGQFLILEGDNPKLSFITEVLGIKNAQVITKSFDDL